MAFRFRSGRALREDDRVVQLAACDKRKKIITGRERRGTLIRIAFCIGDCSFYVRTSLVKSQDVFDLFAHWFVSFFDVAQPGRIPTVGAAMPRVRMVRGDPRMRTRSSARIGLAAGLLATAGLTAPAKADVF
jgi:hypothetical protein